MQAKDQFGGQMVEGVQHMLALPDDGTPTPTTTQITDTTAYYEDPDVPDQLKGLRDAIRGIGLTGRMTWTR